VAIARQRHALPDSDPGQAARQYAETCDRRMLALEGTLTDDDKEGKVVPPLTGTQFAEALAATAIEPKRQYRRNWRNKLVDVGEKGWQVGKEELDKSETSVTTAYTFVRRDGTGFREVTTSGWSLSESVTEYDADHVYEPSVYSSWLSTRLFYASRGMTA
jgi:hypothetical protein